MMNGGVVARDSGNPSEDSRAEPRLDEQGDLYGVAVTGVFDVGGNRE
jgi:hypothetical protein